MFDFQNLRVYALAREQNKIIAHLLNSLQISRFHHDQLSRASLSIALNIAEGAGRFTQADRKRFFVIARGSVYECVSILDLLFDSKSIDLTTYTEVIDKYEDISKMLFGLIRR